MFISFASLIVSRPGVVNVDHLKPTYSGQYGPAKNIGMALRKGLFLKIIILYNSIPTARRPCSSRTSNTIVPVAIDYHMRCEPASEFALFMDTWWIVVPIARPCFAHISNF